MTFEERRVFSSQELRVEGDNLVFGGFPFGSLSKCLYDENGPFRETFLPGSFVWHNNVELLREHGGPPLASIRDGSMKITADDRYLKFRAQLPMCEYSYLLRDALDAGALKVSPCFRVLSDSWTVLNGERLRIIGSAELKEISLTTRPSYLQSCAGSNVPSQSYRSAYETRSRFGKKSSEPKFEHITESLCEVEGCLGANFRGLGVCRSHHVQRIQKLQEQRAADEERGRNVINSPDWPKIWAKGLFQSSNRVCSACGKHGLHHVREKAEGKRPRRPNSYWEVLEVICQDCVDDGR